MVLLLPYLITILSKIQMFYIKKTFIYLLFNAIIGMLMGGIMITKEKLELYAKKLMFEMNDDEYETLLNEFDAILKQMDLIGNIKDIEDVSPMTFPFDLELDDSYLREDIYENEISFDDMKINVKDYDDFKVKVPKVVE